MGYTRLTAGGWDREYGISVSAFRAGIRRGTINMF